MQMFRGVASHLETHACHTTIADPGNQRNSKLHIYICDFVCTCARGAKSYLHSVWNMDKVFLIAERYCYYVRSKRYLMVQSTTCRFKWEGSSEYKFLTFSRSVVDRKIVVWLLMFGFTIKWCCACCSSQTPCIWHGNREILHHLTQKRIVAVLQSSGWSWYELYELTSDWINRNVHIVYFINVYYKLP